MYYATFPRVGSPVACFVMEASAKLAAQLEAVAVWPFSKLRDYILRAIVAEYIYSIAGAVKDLLDRVDRPMLRSHFARHLTDFERCYNALCATEEVLERSRPGMLPSSARRQLRRAIRDLEQLIVCSREFRGEGAFKSATPPGMQGGDAAVLTKSLVTRASETFRSYFVSFWVGLIVYVFVLVAGLTVIILRVVSGFVMNGFTALVIGMIIGAVAVLVDIFRDLRYWRVADAD